MRAGLTPILMPSGLPKRGLVCWHDLYDPTSSLASVPDLSGNGYSLQLGSDAGADTNDPAWGADGKGLVFDTDDLAMGPMENVWEDDGPFTIVFAALPSGTKGALTALFEPTIISLWRYHIVRYDSSGHLEILSYTGTFQSSATTLSVQTDAYQAFAFTGDGETLTCRRLDTGDEISAAHLPWGKAYQRVSFGGMRMVSGTTGELADSLTHLGALSYNRALSLSELQRAYRYLKAMWAARNIQVL